MAPGLQFIPQKENTPKPQDPEQKQEEKIEDEKEKEKRLFSELQLLLKKAPETEKKEDLLVKKLIGFLEVSTGEEEQKKVIEQFISYAESEEERRLDAKIAKSRSDSKLLKKAVFKQFEIIQKRRKKQKDLIARLCQKEKEAKTLKDRNVEIAFRLKDTLGI
jgi:hypothetical protein